MSPLDCYIVRRLITGRELNGELASLSGPARRLADHLATLGVGERPAALETFLALQERAEAERINKALQEADPDGSPPPPDAGAGRRYVLKRTADVTARPVEWLWGDRVPRGMLSLFAGDPKLGKSFVTIQMAADVSRGAPLPHDKTIPDGPGSVLLLSAEDDVARTIVPRLKSAGADLNRVYVLESVIVSEGREAVPSLRTDMGVIEEAAGRLDGRRLIIIDPVSAYLDGADDHRNAELRGLLSPLKALAERTGAAVVLVSHLNKGGGTNGKHRVTGSIAYVGACRANFLFARDPDDEEGRRVLMLPNGCNLAADPPALAYRIIGTDDGPHVEWEPDPIPTTADEVLRAESAGGNARSELQEVAAWLRVELAAGPVPASDVFKRGRAAGYTDRAIRRAATAGRVAKRKDGFGKGASWLWSLPDPPP